MSRHSIVTSDLTIKPHPHTRSGSVPSITSPRTPASPYDPLSAALSTVQARYTIANSKSLKAHNEACHDMPGGNTRTTLYASPFPMTFVKGNGCELTTLDGDVYTDFLGEYTAGIYGHSNEKIASAVMEALNKGWNYGGPNLYERELARKVTERFYPSGIELIRFTNSGTESNMMAIAGAIAFTGRKKVLAFKNGYHGGTLSFPTSMSPTNVNVPHDFVLAPYNDIPATRSILSTLSSDSLAAIIVEPVQGSGGAIVGSKEFLHFLDVTAHTLGAVFIVDEVMTSRLSYHGLSYALDLHPDLVTLGKWIGGGMTFGAFGGRRDGGVMSMFDPRNNILTHAGTFNNNIVTMAAGCAGLDLYTEHQVDRLNALGESLKDGVSSILTKHGVVEEPPSTMQSICPEKNELKSPFTGTKIKSQLPGNGISFEDLSITDKVQSPKARMWISGQGSMLCIHFSGDSENSLMALFWHHMLDHGIYLAPRGFMALNMEMGEKEVAKFLHATERFVEKYRHAQLFVDHD